MKRYNLIVSDAPKVGYTSYLDWWFFPIFYYTCFALFEFIFVQVISLNINITLLINILLYLQSLIGEKRETLAKNVEFFSRVLTNPSSSLSFSIPLFSLKIHLKT